MPTEPAAMLRLAMVLPRLDLGGMEHTVLAQTRALRAAGHDVQVITLAPGGALVEQAAAWQIPVHMAPAPLRLSAASTFIAETATRVGASIIHSHTGAWLAGTRAAQAGLHPRPHLHTRHGFLERRGWRQTVSEFLAARGTARIVCVSTELLTDTQRRLRVPPARCVLLPNGVDFEALPSPPAPSTAMPPVLAMVCRLTAVKNVTLALEALARARATLPALTLQVVGDGPERPALEAQAAALGLTDAVRWHGRASAPWTRIPPGAIAVQSSDSEGLSLALIEAMAMGCRVVATDVGETRAFSDGAAGVALVPPGDADALAHAIVHTAQQGDAAAIAAAESNRTHARARGGLRTVVAALEALYHQVGAAA